MQSTKNTWHIMCVLFFIFISILYYFMYMITLPAYISMCTFVSSACGGKNEISGPLKMGSQRVESHNIDVGTPTQVL